MLMLKKTAIVSVIFLLCSCLAEDFSEKENTLSADKVSVSFSAELESGLAADSLKLTSNQSWGVRVVDDSMLPVDWISISAVEHLNLTGISETVTLEIACKENPVNVVRKAKLLFSSKYKDLAVPIEQAALKYSVSVEGDGEIEVQSASGSVEVKVLSNTSWTAVIGNNDMDLSFSEIETQNEVAGLRDSVLTLFFSENLNPLATRSAVLTLSAEDCPDVIVNISQRKSTPYLTIDEQKTQSRACASDTSAMIVFSTNVPWTAAIAEGASLSEPSLSAGSGDASSQACVELKFGMSKNSRKKSAVVVLSSPDSLFEPVYATVVQTGAVLTLDFSGQPFTEALPETSGTAVNEAKEYTLAQDSEEFKFVISPAEGKYFYRHTGSGSLLCNGGYSIKLPAIENLLLKSVTLSHAASNKSFAICAAADGSEVVTGGEKKALGNPDEHTWNLSGTLESTSYYIKAFSSSSRVTSIVLEYGE